MNNKQHFKGISIRVIENDGNSNKFCARGKNDREMIDKLVEFLEEKLTGE